MADHEQEQRKAIGSVLEHIERHLDQTFSLERLAKLSTYSPFHFHRMFTNDTIMMGVPRNNPYITPPDKCRYDCCIAIPDGAPAGSGLECAVFRGGKFAVYDFEQAAEYADRKLLVECYSELYSYWLPRSGYRYKGNPVEFVQITPKAGTLDIDCRITAIALPIEPE